MEYRYKDIHSDAVFSISTNLFEDLPALESSRGLIAFLWNRETCPVEIEIDGVRKTLLENEISTITYFHKIAFPSTNTPLTALLFNRAFYCIADHDEEVGCNGLLFFGAHDIPIIRVEGENARRLNVLWGIFLDEFGTRDSIQGDMLQMLLKRFILLVTRMAKDQSQVQTMTEKQLNLYREYNLLVDRHFKEKKRVKEYADLLFKSPKSLTNLFAKHGLESPSEIIQKRVVLEANRLIKYSEMQNQEIAFELGFEDPSHFSRYYKKVQGYSPNEFRSKLKTAV